MGEKLLLFINSVAPALGTEERAGKQGIQTEVTQQCYPEVETKILHWGEM